MDAPPSHTRELSRSGLVAASLVAVCTFAVFLPALGNGFVNWDDPLYVGGRASSPWAAFTEVHASGNWHPLATLSHALDLLLWGHRARGHHLTSVVLHALNAGLVVLLGQAAFAARASRSSHAAVPTRQVVVALSLAGLGWSIHPLRVESVAWVSERKDLLCGSFYLLGLLAYLRHAEATSPRWYARPWYWLTVACFAAALMSKPMAVSFPVVVLLLDGLLLARAKRETWRTMLVEKLPLIALSLAAGLLTIQAQQTGGAYQALADVSGTTRALVALQAIGGYVSKMLWPSPLLPYYSYPVAVSWLSPGLALSLLLVASIPILARRQPAIAAGLAAYLVILLPVLGIIQVGPQAMADRYTYLSTIPLVLLAASVATTRRLSLLFALPVALGLGGLGWLAERQIRVWHDSDTLWSHQLAHEPDNLEAHNSRASYYFEHGRYREALADYDAALAAPPRVSARHARKRRAACLNDRAITHVQLGNLQQAIGDESEAIQWMPTQASYHLNRSKMYEQLGMWEPAQADRERARGLLATSAPRSEPH